jgi:hypothetical protein
MKPIFIFFSLVALALTACSSDEEAANFTSDITADGMAFVPTKAKVTNGTANFEGEAALVFTLEKGTVNTADFEAIVFSINYPLTSSSAPSGTYDFGIGVIGEVLFAQGSYAKGNQYYSLAGYTVKVTAQGNNNYKLEFQDIQAVDFNNQNVIIVSGYFEGKVTEQ